MNERMRFWDESAAAAAAAAAGKRGSGKEEEQEQELAAKLAWREGGSRTNIIFFLARACIYLS